MKFFVKVALAAELAADPEASAREAGTRAPLRAKGEIIMTISTIFSRIFNYDFEDLFSTDEVNVERYKQRINSKKIT